MAKHADIRLNAWGKEVDYNLFPDTASLKIAQKNNTDMHSIVGSPLFVNPSKGDFSVKENSLALTLGFKNFPMDKFGVQKPTLKALAKQPDIPKLTSPTQKETAASTKEWEGIILKNIENIEEQSAYGTFSLDGTVVVKIKGNSKFLKSALKEGDVILSIEKEKIKNTADFVSKSKKYIPIGSFTLKIIRNQKEMEIGME